MFPIIWLALRIISGFVLSILGPLLLERYMSGLHEWIWRGLAVVCVTAALFLVGTSPTISPFLVNYQQHRVASTLLTSIGAAILFSTMWLFFVIRVSPVATLSADSLLSGLEQRLRGHFNKALLSSPSVADSAKTPIIEEQISDLSKSKEKLVKRQHVLQEKSITRDSLEGFRTKHLEIVANENQQKKLAQQQKEIEQKAAAAASQAEFEERGKKFSAHFIPAVDYAITALYDTLSDIATQFSLSLESDFPGPGRPSLHNSPLLKDGRFIDGEQIIGFKDREGWEFHVVTSGNSNVLGGAPHKYFGFQIRAGTAIMGIGNLYLSRGNWNLTNSILTIECRTGETVLHSGTCLFSDFQQQIDTAVRALIYNRYAEFRLTADATPPSLTPDKEASPPK